jgi:hypothetical protein
MIWSFGCSWSWGQPWAPDSSDLARRRSGAWLSGCDRVGPSGRSGRVPAGGRGPFPARATRRPPHGPGFACGSAGSPRPFTFWGWLGWVHDRPLGLRGRPYPTRGHARSRRVRCCWVPRDWLWSRPSTPLSFSWMIEARPPHGQGPTRRSMISRTGTPTAGVPPRSEHQLQGCRPGPDSADHIPDSRRGQGRQRDHSPARSFSADTPGRRGGRRGV